MTARQFAAALGLLASVALLPVAHADPAATAFDRLKGLAGDWIDADGSTGQKGQVVVSYRVTGGGNAVVETLFAGTAQEMMTVYNRDGTDIVLTHYCAAGNQPRMRAKSVVRDVIVFDYDGGTNLDPAVDPHMHAGKIEFLGADRIRSEWIGWSSGKPSPHTPTFNLERKKS